MANTTNFNWETPDDTDLVKDGAAAIRTLGSAIDTSLVDLKGGTTDQVLAKNSNTDMDFKWVTSDDANAIQNAIIDAKGDLIVGTAADTPARFAVGTNGYVLTADSTETAGIKWAAAAGGGAVGNGASVLTSQTTTSSTYTDLATVGPSVTVTTGTKAMVIIGAYTGGNGTYDSYMSYAVSGATTVAASNNWAMSLLDANDQSQSFATIQTGLTAGSNTFTAKYRTDGGASLNWANRYILVIDLGS